MTNKAKQNIAISCIIILAIFFLLSLLGFLGYNERLTKIYTQVKDEIQPSDNEIIKLQERELELITETENKKITDALEEEQQRLNQRDEELIEQEKNIQALASTLEEEKNNFLIEQEKRKQEEEEKNSYKEKLNRLAIKFTSMPPERAVERLTSIKDDLVIIDIINKIDEIAEENGQQSIAPYYYSLMKKEDASRLFEKSLISF